MDNTATGSCAPRPDLSELTNWRRRDRRRNSAPRRRIRCNKSQPRPGVPVSACCRSVRRDEGTISDVVARIDTGCDRTECSSLSCSTNRAVASLWIATMSKVTTSKVAKSSLRRSVRPRRRLSRYRGSVRCRCDAIIIPAVEF